MKVIYKKSVPFIKVDRPEISCLYHVIWGRKSGVVGKCISVDDKNKTVVLISPVTGIQWKNPVKWDDLRHTRRNQSKIIRP